MTGEVGQNHLGVVVIGRNEGRRLDRALGSARAASVPVVYVDSGSDDDSVVRARERGVDVVELDPSQPYSAARARNAGVAWLLEREGGLDAIQFIDGDCELVGGWLARAASELRADAGLAVVCGRRRERSRNASIYHRLYDLEWDVPAGDDRPCGGDALVRVAAFQSVGGFRASLIAGEEPELCVRLRAKGWRLRRIDAEMTLHDAGGTSFVRWWRRAQRAGYAFAEGRALHGGPPSHHWRRESRSIWFWGLLLPATTAAATSVIGRGTGVILCAYALLWLRIALRRLARGTPAFDALLYASFCVLGKFPEVIGQIAFRMAADAPREGSFTGAAGENRLPG